MNLGDHDFVAVDDIQASGELVGSRFIDRDDPAFIVDPDSGTTLNQFRGAGDFDATAGGSLLGHAEFGAGADVESAATFNAPAEFQDKTTFTGGDTQFNAQVDSTGSAPAEFNEATSQDIADFNAELEIIGVGVIGGACNANQENLRFNSAGELLECVSAQWQYAGIETRKGTITYYSLDATNGYGEFHWAGDGIDIPGYHHLCSTQSIESSNQAEGGGARVEVNSGQDSFGRHQWQYLAHQGVQDADDIPLVLQSGERTVICMSLGPEPVQPTVSTRTNTAPTGSVTCTTGYVGEPFNTTASVSDPDTPITYQWSATGACSLLGATGNRASIARNNTGTCTVRVTVTDYYNASRTISDSCQVRPIPPPPVDGVCSCTVNDCTSGDPNPDPDEPDPPSGHDPLVDGPWDPIEQWTCEGRNGGSDDGCTEGSSCPSPRQGICHSTRPNDCIRGNSVGFSRDQNDPDFTIYTWTCRGIAGGSDDPCRIRVDHPQDTREDGACGTADNPTFGCAAGKYRDIPGTTWFCLGRFGGNNSPICGGGVTPPDPDPDAVCGTADNAVVGCLEGNYQGVSGPTWNCIAQGTGNDVMGCVEIVNGRCGRPNIGDCADGVSSDPSGNTNPWVCAGSNGGTDATCYHGECGAANNTCVPGIGTPNNIVGSAEWLCEGNIAGNADDTRCVIAVCGDTQGTCDEGTRSGNTNPWDCTGGAGSSTLDDDLNCHVSVCGTADDASPGIGCVLGTWQHVDDTATAVLWKCEGSHSGSTADDKDCSDAIGTCDSTLGLRGKCDSGTSSDPPGLNDSWTCEGGDTNIITDDASCYIGVCDYDSKGDCADNNGDSSDPSGATNPWVCMGSAINSTTDDNNCLKATPDECGTADAPTPGVGCLAGTTWADVPDLTSPTVISWKCDGSDPGGTDDDFICEQEPGDCDTMPGDCVQGVSSDPSGNTHPWVCASTGGGTDETCVFSVCGTQDNAAQGCLPNMPSTLPPPNVSAYQDVTGHTWACQGNARDINCHVGLCDYAGPGQCVNPSTPYDGGYEWTCLGANSSESADDVDCVKAQCNDVGADNDIEGCTTGIWEHVDGPNWNCRGNHLVDTFTGDDDLGCTPTFSDGQCGYDFVGDCEEGRRFGQGNEWKCLGPDDTVDTDDSLPCKIGQCHTVPSAVNTCVVGMAEDIPGDPDDKWWCRGNHPTSTFTGDDVICAQIIHGICGDATDTCYTGSFNDLPGGPWECLGSNGGEDKLCQGPIIPNSSKSSGGCGDQENTCLVGANSYSNNTAVDAVNHGCSVNTVLSIIDMADTPDLLKWRCQYAYSGSCPNGNAVSGSNNISCEIPATPICGDTEFTCDAGSLYDQQAGTWNTATGTWLIPPTWLCDLDDQYLGVPGITCTVPVNAICGTADDSLQGCMAGTWQDDPGDSWTCLGIGGGTDASCPDGCGRFPNPPHPYLTTNLHPDIVLQSYLLVTAWQRCKGIPAILIPPICSWTLDSCHYGTFDPLPGPEWNCVEPTFTFAPTNTCRVP